MPSFSSADKMLVPRLPEHRKPSQITRNHRKYGKINACKSTRSWFTNFCIRLVGWSVGRSLSRCESNPMFSISITWWRGARVENAEVWVISAH